MEKEENLESKVLKALKPKKNLKIIVSIIISAIVLVAVVIFLVYPYISGFAVKDDKNKISGNATTNQSVPEINNTDTNVSETNETAVTQSTEDDETSFSETGASGESSSTGSEDCEPSKSCSYYYDLNQCGDDLSDGCNDTLSCNSCANGRACQNGNCVVLECTSNSSCAYLNSLCGYGICNSTNKCQQSFNLSGTNCPEGICNGAGVCVSININSCINLNQSNKKYVLNLSIENDTLTDACIKILAENITLDCQGYSITSSNDAAGIYSNSSSTTIKNCNVNMGDNSGGYGMYLEQANNSHIYNNSLNSQYAGLFLEETSDSLIENNTINFNYDKGIHLLMSYNNTIKDNIINNGSFYGLVSAKSANNIIQNNELTSNIWYGILIEASLSGEPDGANQILNNIISLSRENIYVKTSNNVIKGNTLRYSQLYNGLYIYNASNNTIENNILNNNKISGIGLNEASNNLIKNNTIDYNEEYGIEVYSSNFNTIENNTASSNSINGLYLEASSDSSIKDNVFCNNTEDVYCDSSQIFESNNCNSGSVCGGSCEACGLGELGEAGITGGVINVKKGLKDYFAVLAFIIVVIALAILVNIKRYKKK